MYLVGADHPLKSRVVELVSSLLSAHEELITSAETFQEIIHRYLALQNRVYLATAYEALEAMVSRVVDVTKADTDLARYFSAQQPVLSSRDCLHAAIMKRIGCKKVWTYDVRFDQVSFLVRVH